MLETEIEISAKRIKKFDLNSIKKICLKYDFNIHDILSVAYAESSFRPDTLHKISGAKGMYQMKTWAINRTNLLNKNVFDITDSTELCCKFLDILRDVDYPKIKHYKYLDLNEFEKIMMLYHYGLSKTLEFFKNNIVFEETKIYINNLRRGKKISFEVLSKKK